MNKIETIIANSINEAIPPSIRDNVFDIPTISSAFAKSWEDSFAGLSNRETAAIAMGCKKTAALCYDRIHSFYAELVPADIRFCCMTTYEIDFAVKDLLSGFMAKMIEDVGIQRVALEKGGPLRDLSDAMKAILDSFLDSDFDKAIQSGTTLEGVMELTKSRYAKSLAEAMKYEHNLIAIPVYSSRYNQNMDFSEGKTEVVVSILSNLDIVDEEALSWDQVRQFREDEESKRKYKRFIHWMDKEMVGKSFAFIRDDISEKLYDYEDVLRKHGIKRTLGTISATFDPRTWVTGFAAGGKVMSLSDLRLGALTGASVIAGAVGLELVKVFLNIDEPSRNEIAWVYEVKQASEKAKESK